MHRSWIRKTIFAVVLSGAALAIACGSSTEGNYRDPSGTINAEFKDGKVYIGLGAYAVDGTYKIEGNKIIARGDFGLMLPRPAHLHDQQRRLNRRPARHHDPASRKSEVIVATTHHVAQCSPKTTREGRGF